MGRRRSHGRAGYALRRGLEGMDMRNRTERGDDLHVFSRRVRGGAMCRPRRRSRSHGFIGKPCNGVVWSVTWKAAVHRLGERELTVRVHAPPPRVKSAALPNRVFASMSAYASAEPSAASDAGASTVYLIHATGSRAAAGDSSSVCATGPVRIAVALSRQEPRLTYVAPGGWGWKSGGRDTTGEFDGTVAITLKVRGSGEENRGRIP